jgi:CheY-like chemotaxis protein
METPPKRILIVEDDESILKILVSKLNTTGLIAISAEDGQQGLEKALSEKPDLILLDILLPVMDGIDMLKELRKDPWGKNVPVIVMTNLTRDDQLAQAFENGVSDYLVKATWRLEDVVDKIKNTLDI